MGKEQKPEAPPEIYTIRVRAQQLFSFWQVARRLDLKENDWKLAMAFVTERLTRTDVYETTSFLNSPIAVAMAKFGFSRGSVEAAERRDKRRRNALEFQREEIKAQIEANYPNPEQRQRARTIELAINSLVAEATPPATTVSLLNNMTLSNGQLDTWTTRWRPQLVQTATTNALNTYAKS